MSETPSDLKTVIDLSTSQGVRVEQTSTRGSGVVELGEQFGRDSIDFTRASEHLAIHTDGEVAGSLFNGELFPDADTIIGKVRASLPESLQYDQHGRAELTITTEGEVVGYSGVKPKAELGHVDGVRIEKAMRTPGGEPAEVEGVTGAWFPEMARKPEGGFGVVTNPDGSVKNPHGKFEPEAWIAHVSEGGMKQASATDKMTVILQKDPESQLPVALTIFPGENAPAFPTKIESETFQVDTLQGGPEAAYWDEHAFVQAA